MINQGKKVIGMDEIKEKVKKHMCSLGLIWKVRWYLCGWWTYWLFEDDYKRSYKEYKNHKGKME